MYDVKYDIKGLISQIYECHKRIAINKRFIKQLELEGNDVTKLKGEIKKLEQKIEEYRNVLRTEYQFAF